MSSKTFKTPKGCHVRNVMLTAKHAEVSFDCGGETGGGKGWFPLPDGNGRSNYQKAYVKGVRAIHTPGATTTGYGAHVDFELMPRHVTCRKTGSSREMTCTVHGADGSALNGARRRKRRK
jgi:hypothetical protein